MANILQLIGLVLDITGAIVMAYDIINIGTNKSESKGTVGWLANLGQIEIQANKIKFRGLVLIILGFLFQGAGTIINICHSMH